MNDSLFNEIQDSAKYLNLDLNSQEMAQFAMEHDLGEKQLQALSSVLSYLQEKKKENIISTLLKLSRLPLKEPKTFETFDFTQLRGKQVLESDRNSHPKTSRINQSESDRNSQS